MKISEYWWTRQSRKIRTDSRLKWKTCATNFQMGMELLRSQDDLTQAEVCEFQDHMDPFFQEWMKMQTLPRITNYIHMLGSGHIAEYIFHWGNLYQHSQQGWEAFNSLIKTFFFQRIAQGGGCGRSKLKPIAKWMNRSLMWLLGTSYEDMKEAVGGEQRAVIGKENALEALMA